MNSFATLYRFIAVFMLAITFTMTSSKAVAADYSVPVITVADELAASFTVESAGNVWETWKSNVFQQVYPAKDGGWATFWGEVCYMNDIPCTDSAWRNLDASVRVKVPTYRIEPISSQVADLRSTIEDLQDTVVEQQTLNAEQAQENIALKDEIAILQEENAALQKKETLYFWLLMGSLVLLLAVGIYALIKRSQVSGLHEELRAMHQEIRTLQVIVETTTVEVLLPEGVESRLGNHIFLPRGTGRNVVVNGEEMSGEDAVEYILTSTNGSVIELRDRLGLTRGVGRVPAPART